MQAAYEPLAKAIHGGDVEAGVAEANRLVAAGHSVLQVFSGCIEPTLAEIGDRFSRLEIFLPEMIRSAEVVKAVQANLLQTMEPTDAPRKKGRIVIGTVSGDLHDIGKNIVKAMLEVNGFEVKDLGVDVSPASAVRSAVEFDAHIIALSALMLPSLPYVRDTIAMVKDNEKYRDRFKIMVGGGPVTVRWAEEARADGYGDDAIQAVDIARQLLAASQGGET